MMLIQKLRQYEQVPKINGDNVIPPVSEIPSLLTMIRHPRRSRSISIGPQSETDAYETLAYREKRRRESISEIAESQLRLRENGNTEGKPLGKSDKQTSVLDKSEEIMRVGSSVRASEGSGLQFDVDGNQLSTESISQYEDEERAIFSNLEKPRVRYDVEVITKLIVYSGETSWLCMMLRGLYTNTKFKGLVGSQLKETRFSSTISDSGSVTWFEEGTLWSLIRRIAPN
jgi:hypothetical protein